MVPGYTSGGMAQGATAANTTLPSAPSHPQQGQNLPSILRTSSPPAYWLQRHRGVNSSLNPTVAPSAPAWGDHLTSIREEQRATHPYRNQGTYCICVHILIVWWCDLGLWLTNYVCNEHSLLQFIV